MWPLFLIAHLYLGGTYIILAMHILKNGRPNDMCYNEIELCPHDALFILYGIVDTIGRTCSHETKEKISTLTSHNFCTSTAKNLKLEITISMVHNYLPNETHSQLMNGQIICGVRGAHKSP